MKATAWTPAAGRAGAWMLLGLAAASAAAQPGGGTLPPTPSQDAFLVILAAAYAPDREALWVLDREAHKLAVYRVDNTGLTVIAVRDLQADFRVAEYSHEGRKQNPSVLTMKKGADAAAAALAGLAPPATPSPLRPPAAMPIGNLLMTRSAYEGGRDVVHVFDSTNRKLAVYSTDGRAVTLLHVRDLQSDLRAVEYASGPPQSPSVKEMNDLTKPQKPPSPSPP
jgi:hypothetical protein